MADEESATADATPAGAFPVVGIGASAGGMEAIGELLRHLPPEPGMAFVLISHLDPQHETMLPEILGRLSPLPVNLASDNVTIEKDHVYVIPPNANLAVTDGHLVLSPREQGPGHFMPIDHFFRSLARERGPQAVAIILSGAGTDGALALGDIKNADGIIFAQDEESAKYDAMPRSAVETGFVDFVLTPADIAGELGRLSGRLANGQETVRVEISQDRRFVAS